MERPCKLTLYLEEHLISLIDQCFSADEPVALANNMSEFFASGKYMAFKAYEVRGRVPDQLDVESRGNHALVDDRVGEISRLLSS